jgi:hypothetical protein
MIREYEDHFRVDGVLVYMQAFKESPWRALQEIGACALILAAMFGALYLKEILLWIGGTL